MRTGNCSRRWAATAASIADFGDEKAAHTPSPVCLNRKPPCPSIALRSTSLCANRAARIPSASDSHRRVEPSISVNKNVTTPEGGPTAKGCHTEHSSVWANCDRLSSGRGDGTRWTRQCLTMRSPPRDTITQLAECLRRADRYRPREFGIHESDGAPDEKERRPKQQPPGYQACVMRGEMWPRRQEAFPCLTQAHRAVPS